MNEYKEAKKLFVDTIDTDIYFDSLSSEYAKQELLGAIRQKEEPLVFLLGDPGTGKSFLLNYINRNNDSKRIALYLQHPFFDNKEFLRTLVGEINDHLIEENDDFDTLIKTLNFYYKDLEYTIFIDEAQLLSVEQLEMIRILSDMKIFQFVLSMHKDDGNEVINKAHFKSRTHKVIYMNPLESSEISRYIQNQLLAGSFAQIGSMFKNSHYKFISKHTNNNFRTVKKLVYTLLDLLDYTQENELKKYKKINNAILTMSAIDIGQINVK